MKLTARQQELLAALLPGPLSPADAAFQMMTTPQAAGRTMGKLCFLQLAYQDVPPCGWGVRYCWTLTEAGRLLAEQNPSAGLPDSMRDPKQAEKAAALAAQKEIWKRRYGE